MGSEMCIRDSHWIIPSTQISEQIRRFLERASRRSALSLICGPDSSPETYKTFLPCLARCPMLWSVRVDFPIPGSPPISKLDPATRPPPHTLLNSSIPEENFSDLPLLVLRLTNSIIFPGLELSLLPRLGSISVSYTHLTLPTILLV